VVRAIVAMETVEMGGEECYVSTLRDITEQRRAELESREQRRELTHLSRVNLLGELSGALAHELNQPLTAILTNAEVAQRYLDRGPEGIAEVREILNEITEADQRAARVIRRMRALLRNEEAAFAPLDLEEVLGEVVEIAHSEVITRSVKVETKLTHDLPTIYGDRIQLQQLFLNLVTNACEAMKDAAPQDRLITIATSRNGENLARAVVADRGPGIATERLHAVFEPFVTSKENGLGLGLAICRTIASAHGGWIWAENGAAGGASILVDLPIHGGPAAHPPDSGEFTL
jgi:C4-dicarboxylate-specific signal transduction histidine kinase